MASACGRYHMVFNGEIYNHLELRQHMPGAVWRGHSDTETLLECIANWGIERALAATVGMFAFAVFDSAERRLILARDRFGEKPLYYGYAAGAFVFASELRPLRMAPGFDAQVDRGALALYMKYSYVPAPRSIYRSMHKLPAGCWLEVTPGDVAAITAQNPRTYWSAVNVALAGEREPFDVSDADAASMLEQMLANAVKSQMLSDVPLGAFLSGGIDSSIIVALMQAQSTQPVRTFSIGFSEDEFDESVHARQVARHLATKHTEITVTPEDALALVPSMPRVYDEPFADSSQLPTVLVAQLARRDVSVALSGDAGDELFGGYNHYRLAARTWAKMSGVPLSLRNVVAHGVRAIPPVAFNGLAALARPLLPGRVDTRMAGDTLHKAADVLACRDQQDVYQRFVSYWWRQSVVLNPDTVVL